MELTDDQINLFREAMSAVENEECDEQWFLSN
jgi:DNA-binding XRE family transcriptional regulator